MTMVVAVGVNSSLKIRSPSGQNNGWDMFNVREQYPRRNVLSELRELSDSRQLQLRQKRQKRSVGNIEMTMIEERPAFVKWQSGQSATPLTTRSSAHALLAARLQSFSWEGEGTWYFMRAPRLTGNNARSQSFLAYELVQGALVRWTESRNKSNPETPTAVFVHGILGGRKNWGSFARRLAQEFPTWQFLLVDLRCHGDSALIPKRGPHTVGSAARDVLQLVGQLKLTPRLLIGHSFGGKVVLSMVDQAAKPLARSVRVWVLDATPGKVRAGGVGEDHPQELIAALKELATVVPSRRAVIDALAHKGFSAGIAQWMTTNLRPLEDSAGFSWVFDINGVADMYQSYEDTNLWPMVEGVPEGVHIDFLRAERSLHRWHHDDLERLHLAERIASKEGAGVQMHVLEDAGHWVHTDNPDGLFRILSSSFTGAKLST